MLPTVPDLIQIEEIVFCVLLVLNVRYQAVSDTSRIEQDAIGVLKYIEFQFSEAVADVRGKARTSQENIILITDACLWRRYIDIEHEIHIHNFIPWLNKNFRCNPKAFLQSLFIQ